MRQLGLRKGVSLAPGCSGTNCTQKKEIGSSKEGKEGSQDRHIQVTDKIFVMEIEHVSENRVNTFQTESRAGILYKRLIRKLSKASIFWKEFWYLL